MGIGWEILWTLCGIATLAAAVPASRSSRWRYVGRGAVGVLFVIGGALAHVVNLVSGASYASFADPAPFGWVRQTWRTVVPPNQVWLIGLLAGFEAVGALVVSGGRRTQLGYAGVIAFYLALWLFGWIETVWCLVMIPAMVLLLLAERRAARAAAFSAEAGGQPAAGTARPASAAMESSGVRGSA